jgi:lysophospholipase L1-like esterase
MGLGTLLGGWADRLKKYYMEKELEDPELDYSVYNLGISGDCTDDLLERFEFEARQRIYEREKIIIIFAIGVNDSCFVESKNIFLVAENKFRKNIQKLIKIAKKYSSKTIFVGLAPVEESKTNPILWSLTGKCYKNIYIEKYDEIIKAVCKNNNIYFISMFDKFSKLDYKKLLEDGLHPNAEGHKKMFEVVRDFLRDKKIVR